MAAGSLRIRCVADESVRIGERSGNYQGLENGLAAECLRGATSRKRTAMPVREQTL
jgi:hypothetical protein